MIPFEMSAALRLAAMLLLVPAVATAQGSVGEIGKQATGVIKDAEFDSLFKEADLTTRYLTALEALEQKYAAAGNLDAIVRLREERESVKQSGATTAHADKEIVELRQKYHAALKVIRDGLAAAKDKIVADVTQKIRAEELALTKAGKVDDALAARKEGERLLLELAATPVPGTAGVPIKESGPATAPPVVKSLQTVTVPKDQPPVNADIFATKDRWLQPVTVPAMKQRIHERIVIGDRVKKSWPLVVVSPGSVWSSADAVFIELSAANMVATRARFDNLSLTADLGSTYYFINCAFNETGFNKAGVWYGSDQAAKFFFDRCHVKNRFALSMNIVDVGVRAQFSVFEGIEFPTVRFFKQQPADFTNHPWMRIVNCRFVKCQIPASFLTLTRDCIFEGCTFVDDKEQGKDAEIVRPMEITLYTYDCKMRISKTSPKLAFIEKPVGALTGVTIPRADSLSTLAPP